MINDYIIDLHLMYNVRNRSTSGNIYIIIWINSALSQVNIIYSRIDNKISIAIVFCFKKITILLINLDEV
jgi:hypothetical protein